MCRLTLSMRKGIANGKLASVATAAIIADRDLTAEQYPKERRPTAARGWAPEARFLRARAGREAGTGGPHLRLDGGHYR